MPFAMTSGSESRTCYPANPVMSVSPPTTIADSSKRCSTATAPEFRGRSAGTVWRLEEHAQAVQPWANKGVWQRLFEHLAGESDNEYAMIDSTVVRAHQHSAGAPKKDD
jgi:transposase